MSTDEKRDASAGRRRRPPGAAGLLVLVVTSALALAACGGSGASGASGASGGASTSLPSATFSLTGPKASGCGTKASSGDVTLTGKIGGHVRTVIVHVPTGYSGSVKVPLVLNLHGTGSTAEDEELFSGMDATSDAHGFIVAYPQGLIPEGTGFDWNVPGEPLFGGVAVPPNAPDDVSFLTQLVSARSGVATASIPPACTRRASRAAPAPPASSPATLRTCSRRWHPSAGSGARRPARPPALVPILSFHGTADPVDPYAGHGQAYWTYSVPQAARDWAQQNGCGPTPATSNPDPGVTLLSYAGCRGGANVELYTIAGEGHEWPGGPALPRRLTRVLGPQSNAIDANSTIWAFFEAHPMP